MKFQNLLLAKAGYSNIVSADGTLAPFVTFTRSTTGTRYNSAGLLESVAINGPRFDYDPATVTSSNLLRYSQEFDNAAWPKTDATVIANAIDAPDGTFTADKLETTTASNPNIQQTLSSVSRTATDMKFSYYVRAGNTSESYAQIFNNGGDGNYAHTATILSGPGSVSGVGTTAITITGLSQTQWTRVQLGVSSNTNTIGTPTFYIKNRVSGSVIGDFTYIWGAQVELGASATAYIPTTASPAGNATLLGLLIEEQRTNLILQSNNFLTSWAPTNITRTLTSTVGPDGTLSGVKIEATAASATNLYQDVVVAATSATLSVYVKQGTGASVGNTFGIRNNTTATNLLFGTINYTTGVFTYSVGSTGATVTNVGNGWWRVQLSVTSGIASGNSLLAYVGFTGSVQAAGDFFFAYGAQLEAAGFATSYIPTTTASVTRTVDDASVTNLSNIGFNSNEGTLFAEANPSLVPAADGVVRFVVALFDNTAYANAVRLERLVGGFRDVQTVGGASNVTGVPWTTGVNGKMAGAYANSNSAASFNGSSPGSLAGAVPPGMVTLGIGGNGAGSNVWCGHIRRIAYYPRRLSNAELQQMTT